jgi:hypothetical protein
MYRSSIISILMSTGLILAPMATHAGEGSQDGATALPQSMTTKQRQLPFHGKVRAVDSKARTLTLQGKEKDRVFQLTEQTKIQRDGKPETLEEVRPGESVGGLARESSAGVWELVTLNIGERASKSKQPKAGS